MFTVMPACRLVPCLLVPAAVEVAGPVLIGTYETLLCVFAAIYLTGSSGRHRGSYRSLITVL